MVTGVSGSGKSHARERHAAPRARQRALRRARARPARYERIDGLERIDKVIEIDQAPIGRTPRSNPATYTGVFDGIRKLFAQVPEARVRGYGPGPLLLQREGRALRGVPGRRRCCASRCTSCPTCSSPARCARGRRYNRETLEIRYKGKSIADVLEMTVEEALELSSRTCRACAARSRRSYDVGLGYLQLGQPATTLSGGEAQRIKLARELSQRATGRTLYLLDEPTTGLHFADVANAARACSTGSSSSATAWS